VSAICLLYRVATDCFDSKLFQLGLERFCIFDLGYLDRHVLFFEKAFHDGLCSLQRQMTLRKYPRRGYGFSKARISLQ